LFNGVAGEFSGMPVDGIASFVGFMVILFTSVFWDDSTYMYFSKYISQPILSVDCFIVFVVYDIDRPHAIFMSLHHLCPNMFWTKIVFFLFRCLTNFF
jgi:hypothetical protein